MPHLVMLPFEFGKVQTHFRAASESSSQGSEKQNDSKNMEVDLVVTLEPQPTELKVTFRTRILFDIVHGSSEAEGVIPTKATTHSHGKIDWTFFNTIAKDD